MCNRCLDNNSIGLDVTVLVISAILLILCFFTNPIGIIFQVIPVLAGVFGIVAIRKRETKAFKIVATILSGISILTFLISVIGAGVLIAGALYIQVGGAGEEYNRSSEAQTAVSVILIILIIALVISVTMFVLMILMTIKHAKFWQSHSDTPAVSYYPANQPPAYSVAKTGP